MRFTISARFLSTASWALLASGFVFDGKAAIFILPEELPHGIPAEHLVHIQRAAVGMSNEVPRVVSLEMELDGVMFLVAREEV